MRNPVYFQVDYDSFFIAEKSALEECGADPGRSGWTDDEIAAVRVALRKLSALRVLNANDAEDIVQDTLLTLIAKCPGNELQKGLLAWSIGVLRKKLGNYYRKAQRYASLEDNEISASQIAQKPTYAFSPETKAMNRELQRIIDEKLAALPPPQRKVMKLLVEGFEAHEIAEQLYPERYQNVINRLYRGRKRLARELARIGYGPEAKDGKRRGSLCKLIRARGRSRLP